MPVLLYLESLSRPQPQVQFWFLRQSYLKYLPLNDSSQGGKLSLFQYLVLSRYAATAILMGLAHGIVPERIRLTFLTKKSHHWISAKTSQSPSICKAEQSRERQEEVPLPVLQCPLEALTIELRQGGRAARSRDMPLHTKAEGILKQMPGSILMPGGWGRQRPHWLSVRKTLVGRTVPDKGQKLSRNTLYKSLLKAAYKIRQTRPEPL